LALLAPSPSAGKIDVHFNSVERLEKYVKEVFSGAVSRAKGGQEGTIDIMIFSFTSSSLADSLLRIARDFPTVKIRILANLSQLFREPTSVLPEMEGIISGKADAYRRVAEKRKGFMKDPQQRKLAIESERKQIISEFREKPIPNIEIRYKWFPAFSWDDKAGKAAYDHFHPKAALLHHKSAVVNGDTLVTGSYNWSTYAETKNLENLMIISGPEDRTLITDLQAEFEAMWNDPDIAKSGEGCTTLRDTICAELDRQHAASARK
jgi:phosphatidylserine/phosphatidylglycerophosphate/cardiolipin synthase-like enzyme